MVAHVHANCLGRRSRRGVVYGTSFANDSFEGCPVFSRETRHTRYHINAPRSDIRKRRPASDLHSCGTRVMDYVSVAR